MYHQSIESELKEKYRELSEYQAQKEELERKNRDSSRVSAKIEGKKREIKALQVSQTCSVFCMVQR